MSALPAFARKETREEAKRLVGQGFVYDDMDAADHHVFLWPLTGETLSIPQTPRGAGWRHRARRDAARITGTKPPVQRRHGGQTHMRGSGFTIARASREQRARAERKAASKAREFAWQLELAELNEALDHANRAYDNAQTTQQRKAAERFIQRINGDIKAKLAARSAA